ncbi:hypothetical protein HPB50_010983 [Hyalomma asiaticum]|uniref:Uncharacterized protein n=1 Tax=Hyalomma asiaticum TaxID=266040 RepID=A0ACB7TG21_HYAAI|nr:hypothetical protein HPB50_010983 [Hyalomma asiaticum]
MHREAALVLVLFALKVSPWAPGCHVPAPCVLAVGGASLRGDLAERARALWPAVSVALLAGKGRPLIVGLRRCVLRITNAWRAKIRNLCASRSPFAGGLSEILRKD